MGHVLEQSVIDAVGESFKVSVRNEAMEILRNTKLWAEKSGPPARIFHTFILISKGSLKNPIKFDSADWRDALIKSGLGDEDWRENLLVKGIVTSLLKNSLDYE